MFLNQFTVGQEIELLRNRNYIEGVRACLVKHLYKGRVEKLDVKDNILRVKFNDCDYFFFSPADVKQIIYKKKKGGI